MYYRKGREVHAYLGEYFGGHFVATEKIPYQLSYDAKCFSCVNFIGCTEPGDIQCSKSDICLNIRIDYTILQCKKNNWFDKMTNRGFMKYE